MIRLKKRRKKGLILSQNKRQLILYSTIIDMPYYSKLKALLTKYEKIYETDFEDLEEFDEELIKIFKYAIQEISDSAEKEWYTKGACDPVDGWPNKYERCQLCNTKNRYIFYIENRYTKQILNVGSDCIIEFPTLNNIDGINISKIKNTKIKEVSKIAKILKFNESFPDAQNWIRDLESEYDNLPILMPYLIYNRVPEIFKEMRHLYNNYINNKIQDEALDNFKKLLNEYFSFKQKIDTFIEDNINEELICTKEIKDWLYTNGKEDIIKEISQNSGKYNSKTIEYITNDNFLNAHIENIRKSINSNQLEVVKISDGKIYISYKNDLYIGNLLFSISNIEFMHFYGNDCIICNKHILTNNLLKHVSLVWNDTNIDIILARFEKITNQLGYSISYKKEINKLTYKNTKLDRYQEISLETFINSNIYLLFLSNSDLKQKYINIFNKINWRKIEDESKYKFNISDISKNPYN